VLKERLNDGAIAEDDNVWQKTMLDIIRLLYPKYVLALREVPVRDPDTKKLKKIDIALFDANGNIDVIEIKVHNKQIITKTNSYRDNYIPVRELSGTIMQAEKYIYCLNKLGLRMTKKQRSELPKKYQVKVTNPSAIIIAERDIDMSSEQLNDFELIKRKYKNIFDILTYDNIVRRLENIISMLEKDKGE